MVMCCVPNCKNTSSKHNFRIPKQTEIRKKWIDAININGSQVFSPFKEYKVCSKHFLDSDYVFGSTKKQLKKNAVPSQLLYAQIPTNIIKNENDSDEPITETSELVAQVEQVEPMWINTYSEMEIEMQNMKQELAQYKALLEKSKKSAAMTIDCLEDEIKYLKQENNRLKLLDVKKSVFSVDKFATNNAKIQYYTGFNNYEILIGALNFLLVTDDTNSLNFEQSLRKQKSLNVLDPKDQFFLTLIRLRRGLQFVTLGDMFGISSTTAGDVFLTWINMIYLKLGTLNMWATRDELLKDVPDDIKQKYPNVIGSISCTEFFIQNPSSLIKQSQCFSNYKSTNTAKSLIMTNLNGNIIYSSPLFTGSISDKAIIVKSGFLNILKSKISKGQINYGDIILADKGFNIEQLLNDVNLELNIPVFNISETQFSKDDNFQENTRHISQERIHVERAIEELKNYEILSSTKAISNLETLEQIFHVCWMLRVFQFPQIKLEP